MMIVLNGRSLEKLPQLFADWFAAKGWQPHAHQLAMLAAAQAGISSLLIAPTGGGKTLAGFLPSLIDLNKNPISGLHTLYISPLKALAADIQRNLATPIAELNLPVRVEVRTGDTSSFRRARQFKKPPHILLTTPESLELILSDPEASRLLTNLRRIVVDEIHALAPGKRGHLTALCIAQIKRLCPRITLSGLSATVAEPERLAEWLDTNTQIIRAVESVPPQITLLRTQIPIPWSGHMGSYAVEDIYKAILSARTTIVFVNTRAQAEFLFRALWDANRENIAIALHHGSLDPEHRQKVEMMMERGDLRAVLATASLDLGLDWGAVDQIIQVGGPKGISRLLQRIGRSNHRLDAPSKALLAPTNRFEAIECIAVMDAIREGLVDGEPVAQGTLDVLCQFIMNAACGDGFDAVELFADVVRASPYRYVSQALFDQAVNFVAHGGYALKAYEHYQRIALNESGRWVAKDWAARRHRMNIGTIVEYETLRVTQRRSGSRRSVDLGQVEEYFIHGLVPGDTFLFAGRLLKYNGVRDDRVDVEPASGTRPKIPSFKGGRLPISPSLADRVLKLIATPAEWQSLPHPIREWLSLQQARSALPNATHLLVESFPRQKLEYLALYTFAGRNANQTLGLLLSQRMEVSGLQPLGFTANDYTLLHWGLKAVTHPETLMAEALTQQNSDAWIEASQMAKAAFRDVALISGLVERRLPGKRKTGRQVTMATGLIYDVLRKYEADHILLQATRNDVLAKLSDISRLRAILAGRPVLHKILPKVSPLAVPLLLDLGIEKVKGGEAESTLLADEARERKGDRLLKEASQP
jgi:ATP-dependent helicase Lhr and Lhr-like helicase